MFNFFKQHYQFPLMLISWVAGGVISPFFAYGLVILSILFLKKRNRYVELIIGFLFILILADSFNPIFYFAQTIKSYYLILLTLLFLFDSKTFNTKNNFIIPFIPFFIVAVITIIDSPIPFITSQKTLSYIFLYFTIPVYAKKCLTENKDLYFKYIVYFITLILILGFVFILLTPTFAYSGNRYSGIFGNPNGVGLFSSISYVLVTVIFRQNPDLFTKIQKRTVLAVIILSVLMSISRNSIFAILIFVLFERFYKISNWLGFIIVLLVALLYQVITLNLAFIVTTLGLEHYLRLETLESGSGRLIAWAFAWSYIQDHIIFGKGFSFDDHLFGIYQYRLNRLGHIGGVHNFYLSMWLNTGLIGLILFMYGFFKTIFKAANASKLAIPIMFSFLFSLTFEGWLIGSLNAYTICFLIVMTIILHQTNNESQTKYSFSKS